MINVLEFFSESKFFELYDITAPSTPIPSQQQKEQKSNDVEEMRGKYRFFNLQKISSAFIYLL